MTRNGKALQVVTFVGAVGLALAQTGAAAQGSRAAGRGTPPTPRALTVVRQGVGSCADDSASAPPPSLVIGTSGPLLHVQIRDFRFACDADPEFSATLVQQTVRLQARDVSVARQCVCRHASQVDVSPLAPGRYTVELWPAPAEHAARAVATQSVLVPAADAPALPPASARRE